MRLQPDAEERERFGGGVGRDIRSPTCLNSSQTCFYLLVAMETGRGVWVKRQAGQIRQMSPYWIKVQAGFCLPEGGEKRPVDFSHICCERKTRGTGWESSPKWSQQLTGAEHFSYRAEGGATPRLASRPVLAVAAPRFHPTRSPFDTQQAPRAF